MMGFALVLVLIAASAPVQPARSPVADKTLQRAERALAAGETAEALRLATERTKADGTNVRARLIATRAHLDRNELDLAYEQVRRALEASPRNVDALFYLGRITAQLAQRSFERLAEAAPDSPRIHQLQAESLEALENNTGAEAEYEAALRGQPDLFDALVGLARLKRLRLACDEAVPLYEKAERIRPTHETAFGLGTCHNVLQNDEAATRYFEQATTRNPKAVAAWVSLGASLNKVGRPGEAVTALRKAIALEPTAGQAYYFLGMAYRALQDQVRAQAAFKRAEALGGAMGGSRVPPGSPPR